MGGGGGGQQLNQLLAVYKTKKKEIQDQPRARRTPSFISPASDLGPLRRQIQREVVGCVRYATTVEGTNLGHANSQYGGNTINRLHYSFSIFLQVEPVARTQKFAPRLKFFSVYIPRPVAHHSPRRKSESAHSATRNYGELGNPPPSPICDAIYKVEYYKVHSLQQTKRTIRLCIFLNSTLY